MSELPEDPVERERVIEDATGFTVEYDGKTRSGASVRGSAFNPKEVTGARKEKYDSSSTKGSEPQDGVAYKDQNDVRDWETQGKFGPGDDAFDVFSEVLDSPAEELEDHEVTTEGAPNRSPFYRDEDQEALYDQ